MAEYTPMINKSAICNISVLPLNKSLTSLSSSLEPTPARKLRESGERVMAERLTAVHFSNTQLETLCSPGQAGALPLVQISPDTLL